MSSQGQLELERIFRLLFQVPDNGRISTNIDKPVVKEKEPAADIIIVGDGKVAVDAPRCWRLYSLEGVSRYSFGTKTKRNTWPNPFRVPRPCKAMGWKLD